MTIQPPKGTISYLAFMVARPTMSYETYRQALQHMRDEQPGCTIGHLGDLTDGGDRTLVWKSDDDAAGNDGSKAIGMITRRVLR
jgi:hypothetical protein